MEFPYYRPNMTDRESFSLHLPGPSIAYDRKMLWLTLFDCSLNDKNPSVKHWNNSSVKLETWIQVFNYFFEYSSIILEYLNSSIIQLFV